MWHSDDESSLLLTNNINENNQYHIDFNENDYEKVKLKYKNDEDDH